MTSSRWISAALWLAIGVSALHAQIGTPGTFVGTVRDSSRAVLPGATVSATNTATGITQKAVSDEAGRYRVPQLPPGQYRLEAAAKGFRAEVREIELTVGRTQEIDFGLSVGEVTESINVTAEAPLVDTTASSVSALVNGTTVRDLPLNGRSFDQLIALSPGTVNSGTGAGAITGTAAMFSSGGNRPTTGKLIIDGSELAGGTANGTGANTASGKLLGVEAIQEFAVVTNNGDASYGKKPGGQVNLVTRSGSNQLHGSVFEFLRNEKFDAKNFFASENDPLRQNNYGFAVGGPVVHDKMFFFFNLEEYKERRGLTLVANTPTVAVRNGVFPDGTVIAVNPAVRGILDLYPLPNGRDFGDGTAQAVIPARATINDRYILGRVDHSISANNSLFGRYLIQTGNRLTPDDNNLGQFPEFNPLRMQLFTVGYKRIFSPRLLNQFTFSYSRNRLAVDFVPRAGLKIPPEMILVPGATKQGGIGVGAVTGSTGSGPLPVLGGQGTVGTIGRFISRNPFEYSDQMNYSRGAHFLQFGGIFQRIYDDEFEGTHLTGFLQFADLRNFIAGRPRQVQGPLPGSDGFRNWSQNYTGLYFQDSYRPTSSLTLNVGLRWEFLSNPTDTKGRTAAFVPAGSQTSGVFPDRPNITPRAFAENHSGNFAPRVGFAWNVLGLGRTSLRGGFGLFYGQLESEFRRALGASAPFYNDVTVTDPPFPNSGQVLGTASLGRLQPLGIQQSPDIPTSVQYNLTLEQRVAPQTVLRVAYVGSHSDHLVRDTNPQIPVPVLNSAGRLQISQAPRNPNLSGRGTFLVWDGMSFYNSLQVELDKRMARGLQLHSAFTWSKAIDEAIEPNSKNTAVSASASVATDHRFDRGLAGYHIGRRLVMNWSYDLPVKTKTGVIGYALGGWQLSGILQAQDGFPFSAFTGIPRSFAPNNGSQGQDRPDLNPNHTGPVTLGGPDRYFDATAYVLQPVGVLGNVGSGTLLGPALVTIDTSITKNFSITERFRLQFKVDAFNLLNHTNFGIPNDQLFTTNGQRLGSAGVIQSTSTTSRELQMALKLVF